MLNIMRGNIKPRSYYSAYIMIFFFFFLIKGGVLFNYYIMNSILISIYINYFLYFNETKQRTSQARDNVLQARCGDLPTP